MRRPNKARQLGAERARLVEPFRARHIVLLRKARRARNPGKRAAFQWQAAIVRCRLALAFRVARVLAER